MTKISMLLGCVVVLTASLALAQKHSSPIQGNPGTCPAGAICQTKLPSQGSAAPLPGNGASSASGVPALGKSALARLLRKTTGKAQQRPGTPDFVGNSNTISGSHLR
jgi:hypothetical protein